MCDYELVTIINPELDEEGMSKIVDKVSGAISSRGGVVDKVDKWGRKKLAYPIKKFIEANYILTRFKLEPKLIKEVVAEIKASEEILRYLVVKAEE